jgi:hypothetical protein
MSTARALLLAVLVLSPWTLTAQGPAEPAPREAKLDAPSAVRAADRVAVPARPLATAAGLAMIAPAPPPRRKVLDKKFFFWTGLAVGLTVADIELTQRCLGHYTCVELNPTLPHSRAGMYLANIPVTGALFYWSYRRKSKGRRLWWLPTLADGAAHAGGVIDNLRFK